jgi:hypothetical protein
MFSVLILFNNSSAFATLISSSPANTPEAANPCKVSDNLQALSPNPCKACSFCNAPSLICHKVSVKPVTASALLNNLCRKLLNS